MLQVLNKNKSIKTSRIVVCWKKKIKFISFLYIITVKKNPELYYELTDMESHKFLGGVTKYNYFVCFLFIWNTNKYKYNGLINKGQSLYSYHHLESDHKKKKLNVVYCMHVVIAHPKLHKKNKQLATYMTTLGINILDL